MLKVLQTILIFEAHQKMSIIIVLTLQIIINKQKLCKYKYNTSLCFPDDSIYWLTLNS